MVKLDLPLTPAYNTKLFCDIWDEESKFSADMSASPLSSGELTAAQLKLSFYLLFQKYGNNPIACLDEHQFKMKVAAVLYANAPTYFKKVDIQKAIRTLDLDELRDGFKSIQNRALNDATEPGTDTDDELAYINEQIVNKGKRSAVDAYAYLWGILRNDLMEEFLNKFKSLFSRVVSSQRTIIYTYDEEEEE